VPSYSHVPLAAFADITSRDLRTPLSTQSSKRSYSPASEQSVFLTSISRVVLNSAHSHEHRIDGKFVAQGVTCSTSVKVSSVFTTCLRVATQASGCNNLRQSGSSLRLFCTFHRTGPFINNSAREYQSSERVGQRSAAGTNVLVDGNMKVFGVIMAPGPALASTAFRDEQPGQPPYA
jgi:hypothetical protein